MGQAPLSSLKRRRVGSMNIDDTVGNENALRILHSSGGQCTGLERIVQDYLREQHRKCLEPVTIIPPFSLTSGKKHQCLSESKLRLGEAPANIFNRLQRRELGDYRYGGQGHSSQDVRLIHGKSKCVRTFRNITRNDEILLEEGNINIEEHNELSHFYTSVAFLHHSSKYEDLLLGTSGGDLVMRNTLNAHSFAKWKVHQKAIRSVAVTPDASRVLTCASDIGSVALSRLPTSVVQEYSGDQTERIYSYTNARGNRPDDELVTVWQDNNIADVELDRYGTSVVATLLNPEFDGHEHAAVVYDLTTGQVIVKLVDTKLSSRYWWHRACFGPDGRNTVLHDGLLWDVRSKRVVHKFDKLSECGRATFKPDGTQVVIDASVWDMRTFKLFVMCPAFEAAQVTFDCNSSVAYSYTPELGQEEDEKLYSSYIVTDASDYSTITTNEVDPSTIQGLALNSNGQKLALITERLAAAEDANWDTKHRVCRLYEIGRTFNADESELNEEQEDDDDEDDDEDDEDDQSSASESSSSSDDGEDDVDRSGDESGSEVSYGPIFISESDGEMY